MSHCIGSSLKIMYIYSQSETFDLLTSFNLETSHAHESVDLKNRQNCLEGNFFLSPFPCYILTVYKWYTNGLDECVDQLQCRLYEGRGRKSRKKRKPSFWNKWNAVKLYDRLWFNYIPGLNVIFHFFGGEGGGVTMCSIEVKTK